MPLEGLQLGHYRLVKLIGSGGMGEVYLGEDTRIRRQVAIKVVRAEVDPYPDASAIREAARLFQREMKAITTLDHPHILPLYDFGEESVNKTVLTYMVMPYRAEGSLADWLQARGSTEKLPPEVVAHFIQQAADALQHAHDHQLIHQDVKPSNFLIRSRATNPDRSDLLLADFGIAKFTTATATASQSIRGTPAFMAPEQWDGHPVAATDQYALAVMAYQLLTGHPPFKGGPGQVMRQHFMAQPQPPSMLNPRVSPALDAVILRALAKQPENRFPSMMVFAQAFEQALQEIDTPSITRGSGLTQSSDIRATLAISPDDARYGTSRTLTLPGGRRVSVSVPAGTRDGQIISLEGLGEPSSSSGLTGSLILTIAIKQEVEPPSIIGSSEQTMRASSPNLQRPPTLMPGSGSYTARPESSPLNTNLSSQSIPSPASMSVVPQQLPSIGRRTLLIWLAVLIIVMGGGLTYFLFTNVKTPNITNTANPYPPFGGTLALNDPLSDNSKGYSWSEDPGCSFTGSTYHVSASQGQIHYCSALTTDFSNIAFEVQMTIISGDCGGITFRHDAATDDRYSFEFCQDGYYTLSLTKSSLTNNASNPTLTAFNQGLNQTNLIAVVANGDTISLYVNDQLIDSFNDSTYGHGQIGFVADAPNNPTEVVFSNAKVWTL